MTVDKLYNDYKLTKNLKLHMYRVTAIAEIITKSINIPHLDIDLISKTCLLHDTGNIIKFDLENQYELIGEPEDKKEYWNQIQSEYRRKYDNDEDYATEKIAEEIGASEKIQSLIKKLHESDQVSILSSTDFNLKVCKYADMRVGPWGVISIEERWDDITKRYRNTNHSLSDPIKNERMKITSLEIESQLQKYSNINIKNIDDKIIEDLVKELPNRKANFT